MWPNEHKLGWSAFLTIGGGQFESEMTCVAGACQNSDVVAGESLASDLLMIEYQFIQLQMADLMALHSRRD